MICREKLVDFTTSLIFGTNNDFLGIFGCRDLDDESHEEGAWVLASTAKDLPNDGIKLVERFRETIANISAQVFDFEVNNLEVEHSCNCPQCTYGMECPVDEHEEENYYDYYDGVNYDYYPQYNDDYYAYKDDHEENGEETPVYYYYYDEYPEEYEDYYYQDYNYQNNEDNQDYHYYDNYYDYHDQNLTETTGFNGTTEEYSNETPTESSIWSTFYGTEVAPTESNEDLMFTSEKTFVHEIAENSTEMYDTRRNETLE